MKNKITAIRRTFQGAWAITVDFGDFFHVFQYQGYTKREAMQLARNEEVPS